MTQHITLWQPPEFETSTKERTFALPTPPSVLGCCRVRAASVDIAIRFSPDIASGNSIAMGPANDDVKKSATAAGKSPNGAIYTACVATTDCRARRDDACSPALLISECARPMP